MRRLPDSVPAWAPWRAAVGLLLAPLAGLAGVLLAALIGSLAGAGDLTPAIVLLAALLAAVAVAAVVTALGGTRDPLAYGLRRPDPGTALPAVGLGLAGLLAAAGLGALLGDPFAGLELPPELSRQAPLDFGPDPTVVTLTADTVLSVIARGIVGVLAAELVLRGFVLAALERAYGPGIAVGVVTVISGAFAASAAGGAAVLVPALAVSAVLCVMYLETGSLVPGAAVAAAAQGALLGAGFDWSAAECAALALACGAGALLLLAPVVLGVGGSHGGPKDKLVPPPLARP